MFLVAALGFLLAAGPGRWESSGPLYPAIDQITAAPAPDDENIVYAGAHDPASGKSALFRSRDGGASWETVAEAPASETLRSFAIDPTGPERMLALTRSWDGVHGQLYRSDDAGRTWLRKASYFASDNDAILFDTKQPNTAYFLFGNLWRSETDAIWEEIAPDVSQAWVSPGGHLYWLQLVYPLRPPYPLPWFPQPPSWMALGSADQGRNASSVPATCIDLDSVVYAPGEPLTAYAVSVNCAPLDASLDGGLHWSGIASDDLTRLLGRLPGGQVRSVSVDPARANDLFAILSFESPGSELLIRSEDAGVHWTSVPVPATPTGPLAISPSGRFLYVGTDAGVYRLSLAGTRVLEPRD